MDEITSGPVSDPTSRKAFLGGGAFKIYELPDLDDGTRRSLTEGALRERVCASAGAYSELKSAASELNDFILESLRYIQRVEEIVAKHDGANFGLGMPWRLMFEQLLKTDWQVGELARKPLIVQLAEQQGFPLREIARGAKRILRRKRDKERVSRAREFDKASLIQIAQLPGRTMAQKAGPRQRIPAVKRFETTDTLENRVVEHFCRLVEAEWIRSENSPSTKITGDYRPVAEGFERLCRSTRLGEDFMGVTRLRSPCVAPNFTLEQNTNYRAIWLGYKRLIQRQTEQEECWAWARRLFLNRALVFAAELFEQAFPEDISAYLPYRKDLRTWASQRHGLWLDDYSFPGPRVIPIDGDARFWSAYILSHHDIVEGPESLHPFGSLNADAYFVTADADEIRVLPIYGFVGDCSPGALGRAWDDLKRVQPRLRESIKSQEGFHHLRVVQPLLIWADFSRPDESTPANSSKAFSAGISVINYDWVSPLQSLVTSVCQSLLD